MEALNILIAPLGNGAYGLSMIAGGHERYIEFRNLGAVHALGNSLMLRAGNAKAHKTPLGPVDFGGITLTVNVEGAERLARILLGTK